MADIEKVTVTVEKLIALPEYENVRFGCSVTVNVDGIGGLDNHNAADEAYAEAMTYCKNKINEETENLMSKLTTSPNGKLKWKQ